MTQSNIISSGSLEQSTGQIWEEDNKILILGVPSLLEIELRILTNFP
jgi:hypothetical protein